MAEDLKDRAQAKLASALVQLGVYRHYKGGLYTVFSTSIDEATLEPLVHYYSHAKRTRWTRTLRNFQETIKNDTGNVPRFEFTSVASVSELVTACFEGLE